MKLYFRSVALLMVCTLVYGRPIRAQTGSPAAVRAQIGEDSLGPVTKALRGYLVELRDTLGVLSTLNYRIIRSHAAGMESVVISSGRQLAKACGAAVNEIKRTQIRVDAMHTADERGTRALAAYEAILDETAAAFESCRHEDSLVMQTKPLDAKRLIAISQAASDATDRHDQLRDAMTDMFGFRLPVIAYIPAH